MKKTNNSNSGKKLIKREHIEGTPFIAINQGKGWFLTMGKYKMSEEYEKLNDLKNWIGKETNWELLTSVIGATLEEFKTIK